MSLTLDRPFELTAPVLGLLLVFRTDTANGRFDQGTSAVWEITSSLRSVIRKLVAWTGKETCTDAERSAALELIDGSLLLHGWIMGSYLRGKALKAAQEAQLFRFALGSSYRGGMTAGEAAMTPYLAITALSLGVSRRLTSLTDQETVSIDEEFSKMTEALGKCEKLLRAPIPLGYTRYSVRFLWLWLSLLPFALAGTFAEFGVGTWWEDKPQPALAVAVLFVSCMPYRARTQTSRFQTDLLFTRLSLALDSYLPLDRGYRRADRGALLHPAPHQVPQVAAHRRQEDAGARAQPELRASSRHHGRCQKPRGRRGPRRSTEMRE